MTLTWIAQRPSPVYTVLVDGVAASASVEKTQLGGFLVSNAHHRPLGTFTGLRAAVEYVLRQEPR